MNQMQTEKQDPMIRFSGIARLYGVAGLEKLQGSHAMVIGLGGVGSWTVESLARSGVGKITLVDFDDICLSNTNRQLHALTSQVGKLKSVALKERCLEINPDLQVSIIDQSFSQKTQDEIFVELPDIVVDAIDNTRRKIELLLFCREKKIPVVVVGAAGGRRDPTQIRTVDLSLSKQDPILAMMRRELRQKWRFPRKGKFAVTCVYSDESPKYATEAGEICEERPDDFRKPLDCATGFGTATSVTGTFGFFAAHVAIETLLAPRVAKF